MIKQAKVYHSPGIYKILNIDTKDFYIGSSLNVYRRMYSHQTLLRNNRHPNIHLQRAWNKYGQEKFEYIVLEYVDCKINERQLHRIEQQYLDDLIPSYNISRDAISPLSTKHAPRKKSHTEKTLPQNKENWNEVKSKISNTVKSLWADGQFREYQLSCMNSPEAKENYSNSMRERWENPEYKERVRASMSNKFLSGNNKSSNLSEDDVLLIRELARVGTPLKEIERLYETSRRVIWRIVTRRTWNFVQ